jgi:hypothetical protein
MIALFTDTALRTSNITHRLQMPQVSLAMYIRKLLASNISEFVK